MRNCLLIWIPESIAMKTHKNKNRGTKLVNRASKGGTSHVDSRLLISRSRTIAIRDKKETGA